MKMSEIHYDEILFYYSLGTLIVNYEKEHAWQMNPKVEIEQLKLFVGWWVCNQK